MKNYSKSLFLVVLIILALAWWALAARVPDRNIQTDQNKTILVSGKLANLDIEELPVAFSDSGSQFYIDDLYKYLSQDRIAYQAILNGDKEVGSGASEIKYSVILKGNTLEIKGMISGIRGPLFRMGYLAYREADSLYISVQYITGQGFNISSSPFMIELAGVASPARIEVHEALSPTINLIEALYRLDSRINREVLEPAMGYSSDSHRVDPSYPLSLDMESRKQLLLMCGAYRSLFQLLDERIAYLEGKASGFQGREEQISNLVFWRDETHRHLLELLKAVRYYTMAESFAESEEEAKSIEAEKKEYLSLKNYYRRVFRF